MENYGLVIHDDQSFLAKVVELGVQLGALTRERADEIIRISVAMANKYVLQKEIDFRSVEQLARVQQTILRLVGVGLEIKSKGNIDQGIDYIRVSSPVDLFRLAYTRIENLRNEWKKLLLNHKIQILVNQEDYECLSEIACQILAEMSVFTEAELYTIRSITLDDDLFTSLSILEYYESELRRYQFILKLKDILPFDMLNRSPLVKAENLSEVDSIREALINTLVISGYVETESPIAVGLNDVRRFLESIDWSDIDDPFPVEIETPVIDVIHELGQGLDENDASLLAKEVIRSIQKLVTMIVNDWKTVNSPSMPIFFKRWTRIAILSDKLDELEQLITPSGRLDEFEFENLVEKMVRLPELEINNVTDRLPWDSLSPDQVIRLFHDVRLHQKKFVDHVSLVEFSGPELIDLIEIMETGTLKIIIPKIKDVLANLSLELEDLEILASVQEIDVYSLLRVTAPPQLDKGQALLEFRDGGPRTRKILFHSCVGADFFPDFFLEVWAMDPQFVKREIRSLSPAEMGPFIRSVLGSTPPKVVKGNKKEFEIEFMSNELNSFYNSLPATKKKAVIRFFYGQDK
ncbi:MAG: DUF6178 family protein [Deltaproteobacteria bacterium]|nr:DUF6178 family protein [Deltaproteobacteria bacterium]